MFWSKVPVSPSRSFYRLMQSDTVSTARYTVIYYIHATVNPIIQFQECGITTPNWWITFQFAESLDSQLSTRAPDARYYQPDKKGMRTVKVGNPANGSEPRAGLLKHWREQTPRIRVYVHKLKNLLRVFYRHRLFWTCANTILCKM